MKTGNERFWQGYRCGRVVNSMLLPGLLFYGYIGDEWFTPPLDERSVPAAKTY